MGVPVEIKEQMLKRALELKAEGKNYVEIAQIVTSEIGKISNVSIGKWIIEVESSTINKTNTETNNTNGSNIQSNSNTQNTNQEIAIFSDTEIQQIRQLLSIQDRIFSLLNNSNNVTITQSFNVKFDDIKPQTLFVSKEVFEDFKTFCKENHMQMKDIVSLALLEFIQNHSRTNQE